METGGRRRRRWKEAIFLSTCVYAVLWLIASALPFFSAGQILAGQTITYWTLALTYGWMTSDEIGIIQFTQAQKLRESHAREYRHHCRQAILLLGAFLCFLLLAIFDLGMAWGKIPATFPLRIIVNLIEPLFIFAVWGEMIWFGWQERRSS